MGSLFRTADAVAVGMVYLVGYTPAPVDKYGKVNSDIAKSALGGEKTIEWKKLATITPIINKLKKDRYTIIAIEQDKNAVDYKKIPEILKNSKNKNVAFVLGNEVTGIHKNILSKVDIIAEIPMHGKKESLNVSVAGGVIAIYLLARTFRHYQ